MHDVGLFLGAFGLGALTATFLVTFQMLRELERRDK